MGSFLRLRQVMIKKGIQISPERIPRLRCWAAIAALSISIPLGSYASDTRSFTTSHFEFYFYSQDERVIKPLIDEAEGLRAEIVKDLGLDFKDITKVYLAPSLKTFHEIQSGRRIQPWSVGVAYPRLNLIILLSPKALKRGHMDLRKVFTHEFTHIALGKAFTEREVPRWLHEGLSMYESKEWDFRRISTITRAVLTSSLIPLSEITQRFPQEENQAELSYSESFYLISFLINEFGLVNFHRFIEEYRRDLPLDEVLIDVYGLDLKALEGQWRSHLKMRFSWIPIITSTTTLWFLVTIVFIIGYMRRRRAKMLQYEQWEREEFDE
jgi:hypothetical protein